jgi:kynurenine formamidase
VPTQAEFRRVADQVRNWGRWGAEDQLGTLNFITDETVAASAQMVRAGRVFALGVNLDANGVWSGHGYRRNPVHLMTVDGGDSAAMLGHLSGSDVGAALRTSGWGRGLAKFNDDFIIMPLQAATQWDALSHVYYDDQMYNGFPASAVTSAGATRNSIDQIDVKGIVGRGVLIDLARARGVEHLPPRTLVEPDELDSTLERQGVRLAAGDIVLVRTGWWPQFAVLADGERWRFEGPGLSWRCAPWLYEHQVAAVAADNIAVEGPAGRDSEVFIPLHLLCLRDMGMMLGEMWNLEALAADSAATGIYDCQLIAPPLRVTGAVGSPVNPIALR